MLEVSIGAAASVTKLGFSAGGKLITYAQRMRSKNISLLALPTLSVMDVFADGEICGVWDVARWNYQDDTDIEQTSNPFHVNGHLFVHYREPNCVGDQWSAGLYLKYTFNSLASKERRPSWLRPHPLKDFEAVYSAKVYRGTVEDSYNGTTQMIARSPSLRQSYASEFELKMIGHRLEGILTNTAPIAHRSGKPSRAEVVFHNQRNFGSLINLDR